MPLISTAKIDINTEPQAGTITVTPTEGNSLDTIFKIEPVNFFDDDAPLQYRFYYYTDEGLYELERELGVNPVNSRRDFLRDGGYLSELSTRLPMGRKNSNSSLDMMITVMVSVTDSLGAVTNSTISVKVRNKHAALD